MNPDHIRFWKGTLASVERIGPKSVRVRRVRGMLCWKRTETLDFAYSAAIERFVHVQTGIALELCPLGVWQSLAAAMAGP